MTDDLHKRKDVRLRDRGDMTGKYLSKKLSGGAAPKGECLSCEEIAAFIDGRLDDPARARVVEHLADCGDCYRTYADTLETLEDLAETGQPGVQAGRSWRRALFIALPSALAAGIAIFLVLRQEPAQKEQVSSVAKTPQEAQRPAVAQAPPVPGTVPGETAKGKATAPAVQPAKKNGVDAVVTRLAARVEVRQLAGLLSEKKAQSYGFSGGSSAQVHAFRLGGALVELEVAVAAGDRDKARSSLAKIVKLTETQPEYAPVANHCRTLLAKLDQGEEVRKAAAGVERLVIAKADRLFLEFGMWVEGGVLSTRAGDGGFATVQEVRRFRDVVSRRDLPAGVGKALVDIEGVLGAGKTGEGETRKLRRAFETVRELM